MPTVYRAMTPDDDGKPMIGRSARRIGVRVGPGPNSDITPDKDGNVGPGSGGMSVAPTLVTLPEHRVPKRLRDKRRGAIGKNEDACYRLGKGDFVDGKISDDLNLRVDSSTHGVIEPSRTMKLEEYELALEATVNDWEIDEA